MLPTVRARPSKRARILGHLTALGLLTTVLAPRAALAQTPDPFGAGAGGAFGGSFVTSPSSPGELFPSYNFGAAAPEGSTDVPALTAGRPVITYTLGGAYCKLGNGEQVWVPSGASTDAMGCGRVAGPAPTSSQPLADTPGGE